MTKSKTETFHKHIQSVKFDAWYGVVFLLSLAARLIYLWQAGDSVFFDAPVIDAQMYDKRAIDMLTTGVAERAFYQAPLYSAFLAAIYFLFGHNYLVPRLIQCVLGAFNCVLIQWLGVRLGGRKTGIAAGLIAAFYGPFIFFEMELLRPVLVIFLSLSFICCLLMYGDSKKIWMAAVSGLLFGLSVVTRENIVVFIPAALIYLWIASGKRVMTPAIFILAAIIPVVPVTGRNYVRSGDFVPVSSQGGMNFYIGNSSDSERLTALQPGIEWDRMAFSPKAELGDNASSNEYSSWFVRKTLRDIREEPFIWAGKIAKKIYLVFYAEELTPNTDIDYYRKLSWLLRILITRAGPVWIPMGLLFPFFVIGLAGQRPGGERSLLLSYVILYALSIAVFHVRARYRIPVVPVMIPFAASGIFILLEVFKKRETVQILQFSFLFLAAAVFVNAPLVDVSFAEKFPTDYFIAKALDEKGETRKALAQYEKAVAAYPDYAELHHDYGQALLRAGSEKDGMKQMELAGEIAPDSAFIRKNLGQLYRKLADKYESMERNKESSKEYIRMAISEYEHAERIDPFDVSIIYDLAFLYEQAGEHARFIKELNRYVERAGNRKEEREWVKRAREYLEKDSGTGSAEIGIEQDVLGLAQMYIKAGNYEKAVEKLRELVTREPGSDSAYAILGNAYKKLGRTEECEEVYKKAIDLNPDNLIAQNNIANLYRDTGRYLSAEKHYREALRISPDNKVVIKNYIEFQNIRSKQFE